MVAPGWLKPLTQFTSLGRLQGVSIVLSGWGSACRLGWGTEGGLWESASAVEPAWIPGAA